MSSEAPQLDIVIPVYNEGGNIVRTLQALADHVKALYRVLICYDFEEDLLERSEAAFEGRHHAQSLSKASFREG